MYEQERKEICLCARGRREGERWDPSPEGMDYLEMSHPAQAHASCPCLTEGDPLSHGVRAWQGSAGAEIHPRDQKILQVPWVASQSSFVGGRRVRSNSRDCGKALQHSFALALFFFFWTQFLQGKTMRTQMEKCRKLITASHWQPFSSFSKAERLQHKQVAKKYTM